MAAQDDRKKDHLEVFWKWFEDEKKSVLYLDLYRDGFLAAAEIYDKMNKEEKKEGK